MRVRSHRSAVLTLILFLSVLLVLFFIRTDMVYADTETADAVTSGQTEITGEAAPEQQEIQETAEQAAPADTGAQAAEGQLTEAPEEGQTTDQTGETAEGQQTEGEAAEGQTTDIQTSEGEAADGQTAEGQPAEDQDAADAAEAEAAEGETAEGQAKASEEETSGETEEAKASEDEQSISLETYEYRSDGRFYMDGVLQKNKWIIYKGQMYFVNATGYPYRNTIISFGKKSYFMDASGVMQAYKVVSLNEQYYYAGGDGTLVKNQWVSVNGVNTYFAGSDGAFYKNMFISFGSKRYYMTSNGSVARGSFRAADGKRYYSDPSTGLVKSGSGWITDDSGKRYFQKADGTLYTDMFISFGRTRYYMSSDGSIAKGSFRTSDGKQFYADPETGVVSTASGWITDGENKYFAKADGELYKDQFISFGKTKYYMTSNGSIARGSFTASDGKQYYADPETGIVRTSSGWLTLDNKKYFYKPDGTLYRNQFISFGKVMYYMGADGSVQTGPIKTEDNKYYVADEDGKILTTAGWVEYDGKRYFAKAGGELYRRQFISFGKTYYYLGKDGSMQTGEQTICGKKYTFGEDGKLNGVPRGTTKGIDVSEYQGDIDWAKVKASGIDFAFVRAGGRGGNSGDLFTDEKLTQNLQGAIANGIQTGVYFFTQAVSASEAIEEANYVIDRVQGYDLTMPVVIDTEELYAGGTSCRHNNISVELRTVVIKAFCEQVIARGYTPMIYGSTSWLEDRLDMSQLPYDVWVAQYYKKCEYEGEYSIWQYAETGLVNGIEGYVDMNEWCY